jgi:hypothetical protein
MRHVRTRTWLLTGALGAAWLLGSEAGAQTGTIPPLRPSSDVVVVTPGTGPRPSLSFGHADPPQKLTISSGNQSIEVIVTDRAGPVIPANAAAPAPASTAPPQSLPLLTPVPRSVAPPPTRTTTAAAPVTPPPASVGRSVPFPRSETEPRRRAYLDLTAAACFAHDPGYAWVIGQVEYSVVARQWRLRYASVDEVDRFGGHVTLIDDQHVRGLTDGMYVHVRGHIVNPESSGMDPTYYRIESLQQVTNPNTVQAPTR